MSILNYEIEKNVYPRFKELYHLQNGLIGETPGKTHTTNGNLEGCDKNNRINNI